MAVIEYKTGDLLAEKADALVNAVNCVGNMGAGIALQFRKAWLENFRAYTVACRNGQLQPGRMFTFEACQLAPPRYIINFPTKRHWRSSSRLEDIHAELSHLAEQIAQLRYRATRERLGNREFDIWSFAHITDLRTQAERDEGRS